MHTIIIGYVLIYLGIGMIVLELLIRLGAISPIALEALPQRGPWDFLIELLKKAPWPVAVGLILIYEGMIIVGAG